MKDGYGRNEPAIRRALTHPQSQNRHPYKVVISEDPDPRSDVPESSAEIIEGLNDLLQLDHDAIGGYEIAIEHLRNRDHAIRIEGFCRDHERHIRRLNDAILELGGVAVNEPHATAPLKQAIQRLSSTGGDKSLLAAWRANELQVRTKYDSYAERAMFWPAAIKRLIDENALDEERHYQWIVTVMAENQSSEGDFASRLKEGVSRARDLGGQAQERLVSAAGEARVIAADKLQQAARQLEDVASQQRDAEGFRGKAAAGAHKLANGLDSTAALLRDGGAAEVDLRAAAEEEIRTNLGRSLVTTFAIGFIVGRILR